MFEGSSQGGVDVTQGLAQGIFVLVLSRSCMCSTPNAVLIRRNRDKISQMLISWCSPMGHH